MEKEIRIVVVEDDVLIARLIQQDLEDAQYKVVGVASNADDALRIIFDTQPDLIFLDITIEGDKDGIDLAMMIKEKYNIPFIFLTALSDRTTLQRARLAGPCAYLVKPYKARDLRSSITIGLFNFEHRQNNTSLQLESINKMAVSPLTNREFDILKDIVEGLTNAQIANQQYLSVSTVKWHLQNIYSKLGVKNRSSVIKMILAQ